MAQMIPSLSCSLPRMTRGEKQVARLLCSLLDDDCLIWFDIPLRLGRGVHWHQPGADDRSPR